MFTNDNPKEVAGPASTPPSTATGASPTPIARRSMLTFCIKRAGKDLPKKQWQVLGDAKDALPKEFGRAPKGK